MESLWQLNTSNKALAVGGTCVHLMVAMVTCLHLLTQSNHAVEPLLNTF